MADINNGWATNFIYQQDLTSYFMNNTLRSIIRPGIYNANMALYLDEGELYLTLKKGTTFVFSNEYFNLGTGFGIRRNMGAYYDSFEGVSNNNRMALIKSVVLRDLTIKMNQGSSFFNDGYTYSLNAFLKYDPLTSDTSGDFHSSPSFFFSKENTSEDTYSDALYEPVGYLIPSEGTTTVNMPHGSILDGQEIDPLGAETQKGHILNLYFLQIGFIVPKKSLASGDTIGIKDYVFTGRGLPEYRHTLGFDSDRLTPDIIPDALSQFRKVYFDIPVSFTGTGIFEKRIKETSSIPDNDWEAAYLARRVNSDDEFSKCDVTAGGTEVFYALVSNLKSYCDPDSSAHPYDSTDTLSGIEFGSIVLSNLSLSSLDYYGNTTTDEGKKILKPWLPEGSGATEVIPLDICRINQDRILKQIIGKDIWSPIIDSIRENSELDPSEITDIIPIAIAFKDSSSDAVDPTNMISYFDLRNKMTQINNLDILEHNIYNVIPVMN
ncbi:MAG: hypothetical protein J6T31_03610 [Methanobrevibacter sp.]|nr:hypothetical protein [Methanobrevibacter sp.]